MIVCTAVRRHIRTRNPCHEAESSCEAEMNSVLAFRGDYSGVSWKATAHIAVRFTMGAGELVTLVLLRFRGRVRQISMVEGPRA